MEIHKLKKFKLVKFIIIGIFLVEIIVPLIYLYIKQIEKCFNTNYVINVTNLLNSPKILANNPIIFVILIGILVIFFMAYYNLKTSLKNANIETEGIIFKKKDGTHGTAGFANINDLKHILQVGNEKNTNGIILGKTIDTDEIIILPDSYKKLNRNKPFLKLFKNSKIKIKRKQKLIKLKIKKNALNSSYLTMDRMNKIEKI